MNCSEVRERLSPWLDGELDAAAAEAIDEHVLSCEECSELVASIRVADAELSAALVPSNDVVAAVAERVIGAIDETPSLPAASTETRSEWMRGLVSILVAMAAGFMIAVLLFQPWRVRERVEYVDRVVPQPAVQDAPPLDASVARFVVATGPVSVRSSATDDWSMVANLKSFSCPSDSEVRTEPGTRAELETVDGCVIRLNDETQLTLVNGRSVALDRGEIWCSAPKEVSLEVRAGKAGADEPDVTGTCASGTSLWGAGTDGVRVTTAEGDVAVRTSSGERQLARGQSVVVRDGNVVPEDGVVDPLLATGWMHPLLVEKGGDDPELQSRVDAYLARVGLAKLSFMYENDIRCLGEHAALPLLRFVQSPLSREGPARRRRAATILADVATVATIGELIELLADDDAEIRVSAARGLERLTTATMGRPPEDWRDTADECAETHAAWVEWWRLNASRYPSSPASDEPASGRRGGGTTRSTRGRT